MRNPLADALAIMEGVANGVYEVGIFLTIKETYTNARTPLNMIRRYAMLRWANSVNEVGPICLSCEKVWRDIDEESPPGAFGYIQPNVARPPALTLTAICTDCCKKFTPDELMKAMMELATKVMPDCKLIDGANVHAAHEVRQ